MEIVNQQVLELKKLWKNKRYVKRERQIALAPKLILI